MDERKIYYVYVIFRVNGVPCYIGKGHEDRYLNHKSYTHNLRLRRLYAKHKDLPVVIVSDNLTEQQALEAESNLIRVIGRANLKTGPLINLTDGGDGVTGWVPTKQNKKNISNGRKGIKASSETKRKMSLAGKGRRKSPEHRAAIGKAHEGKKKNSKTRANMKIANIKSASKRAAALRDYFANLSPEEKAKRSAKIRAGMTR